MGSHHHRRDSERDHHGRSWSRDNLSRTQHQRHEQPSRSDARSRISHLKVESRHANVESRHAPTSSNVSKERDRDRHSRGHQVKEIALCRTAIKTFLFRLFRIFKRNRKSKNIDSLNVFHCFKFEVFQHIISTAMILFSAPVERI